MAERLAVPREARGAVGEMTHALLVSDRDAAVRAQAPAMDALATLGGEERDHAVARLDERDSVADSLDDACALVTEDTRRVARRVGAGGRVEIRVADAARGQADEHLPFPRLLQLDLLDGERLPELLQHRCPDPHSASFLCAVQKLRARHDRGLVDAVVTRSARLERRKHDLAPDLEGLERLGWAEG